MSRSRWRSHRLLILCYHGFSQEDEHRWNPALYVPGEHLASRLELLQQKQYVVLPLGEGLDRLARGTLPPRSVAITVDDGNYDFYAVAYPILKREGVPATVYVSTYYVLDQKPVFDVTCSYLLWKGRQFGHSAVDAPGGSGDSLSIATETEAARATNRIRARVRDLGWGAEEKHRWLGTLSGHLGVDWQAFQKQRLLGLMNQDELAALDPAVADIQLHTHRHRVPDDRELFLREIRDNRRVLSECGRDPLGLVHFCYPSGVHRPWHLDWLAETAMRSAVTGTPGLASKRSPPFLLPRFIDAATTSAVEFEAWASGVRHFLRRRTRAFAVEP